MDKKDDVLHPEGLYNPLYRFAFTNITEEDLTSYWNGRPIVVKAGQTVKLSHHLAVKLTKELVDKIMIGEAKLDETKNTTPQNPYYRSPKGMSLGVPAARKVWEDKIVKQLESEQDAIQLEVIRSEMIETLTNDLAAQPSTTPVGVPMANLSAGDKLPEAFAELKK